MKQLSSLLFFLLLSAFVLQSSAQSSALMQTANTNEQSPYKISFANLNFGNADYSKIILNTWKAYDDNKLEDFAFVLADTLKAIMSDGNFIEGRKNFLEAMKAYRATFSSVVSNVSACTTLKSPNVPAVEVVVIWGRENTTKKDGTTQVTNLHEVWFFNKEGKVTEFHQYSKPMLEK